MSKRIVEIKGWARETVKSMEMQNCDARYEVYQFFSAQRNPDPDYLMPATLTIEVDEEKLLKLTRFDKGRPVYT